MISQGNGSIILDPQVAELLHCQKATDDVLSLKGLPSYKPLNNDQKEKNLPPTVRVLFVL